MELSIYLAQLMGVAMVVVGLALLLRANYYQKLYKDLLKDEPLVFMMGWLVLVIGLVLVMAHNVWVGSWEVIITIFAWLALVKGVLLLLAPGELLKWSAGLLKNKSFLVVGGLFYVVLGAVLVYYGYFV